MAAAAVCTICMDADIGIAFECTTKDCNYQMCSPCLKGVLRDSSSASNGTNCPMCKESTGVKMVEAVAGKGAVRLVENELRSSVEYEIKSQHMKDINEKKACASLTNRARELFHQLSDKLTMKCPRCGVAFDDYDGCNALRCSCGAAFCAVCLEDCQADAHAHVRSRHGDLFDKSAFEKSRATRERTIVEKFFNGLQKEPFEVKQMVQNQIMRAQLGKSSDPDRDHLFSAFIAEARKALEYACRVDRLSILRDFEDRGGLARGLTGQDISPRLVIPDEYRVTLRHCHDSVYSIEVFEENANGQWKQVLLEKLETLSPAVDALTNIKQSSKCAVLAFQNAKELCQSQCVLPPKGTSLADDQVSIALIALEADGNISGRQLQPTTRQLLGLNQNLRMTMLFKHVEDRSDAELAFDPLRHLVGVADPIPILEELDSPAPLTIDRLNEEQKTVAHPLCLRTAMEVAGPPGTGKTQTISEMVRCLIECTTKRIVVMSERNGAIDAIAEKFARDCLVVNAGRPPKISDLHLWNCIMTYGASSSVGPSTELFTLEARLKYHPELVMLRGDLKESQSDQNALARKMRDAVAVALAKCSRSLDPQAMSDKLSKNLQQPLLTISYLDGATRAIKDVLKRPTLKEEELDAIVEQNSVLLGPLCLVRREHERKRQAWDHKRVIPTLKAAHEHFLQILKTPMFSEETCRAIQSKVRDREERLRLAEVRVTLELPRMARLQMSTIGSSHKLLGPNDGDESMDEDEDEIYGVFEKLTLENDEVVVVFDEAGCIPSYELLGLTRLDYTIEALILVGDKEQLPPYQSSAVSRPSRPQASRHGAAERDRGMPREIQPRVKSLLDTSRLSLDRGEKVKLTTQYRVPRDIADLLNDRVYKGDYKTSSICNAPKRGLYFIGVESDLNPRKKYVNKFEVDKILEIIAHHPEEHIMILTPYKNQQREIQFQLKRRSLECHQVLTIDQCQGQEADVTILSLVQKPTRFLNKNRLNVALSRVRKKFYFLTDKREFRKAASNKDWDCHLMATDLLELWDQYNDA